MACILVIYGKVYLHSGPSSLLEALRKGEKVRRKSQNYFKKLHLVDIASLVTIFHKACQPLTPVF